MYLTRMVAEKSAFIQTENDKIEFTIHLQLGKGMKIIKVKLENSNREIQNDSYEFL